MTAPNDPLSPDDHAAERWRAALVDGVDGTEGTDAEAKALRDAILRREQREAANQPAEMEDQAGLQRLLFRLRSERLLDGAAKRWWKHPTWLAMAASIALVALSFPALFPTQPEDAGEDVRIRGTATGPQLRVVADPAHAAEELRAKLKRIGIEASVSPGASGVSLRATVPVAERTRAEPILTEDKLRLPASGEIRVLFTKAP